ncbi:MAG TPA: glycosyltransferase family 2 protein [Usitatibacteraceae bacterium]|nr:glycosyltransferase family 2 protein [Usitatibacteraceae bacterium]
MINGKKVVVVMPAYRAAATVEKTWRALPHAIVDHVLLVDDASGDETAAVARALGIDVHMHSENRGYGGNQKTCYSAALAHGADIVVMVHPDYQYEPRLVTAMAAMIESGVYDVVLGSRILGGAALSGGMPLWKYGANRALTAFQNLVTGAKLSEYHSGYRAFSRQALQSLPLLANSDDFVFDNQILVQAIARGLALGEISCPTRYENDSSSISLRRSIRYGVGVLHTTLAFALWRARLASPAFLDFSADRYLGPTFPADGGISTASPRRSSRRSRRRS